MCITSFIYIYLFTQDWWDAGMVMCMGQGADFHMAQLVPLPLTISYCSKSRLVLPIWCRLSWVVPDKIQEGQKNGCVCVFVTQELMATTLVLSRWCRF